MSIMRLLNAKTLQFRQFFDADIPEYVILSHRWEKDGEIEFAKFNELATVERKAVPKIGRFCALADAHKYLWVWVDTCCIDKRSSTELTEAINSMYRWYGQARRCYVYFNDVKWNHADREQSGQRLRASEWFTRGWTLQELLAPRFLECYDMDWKRIGSKDEVISDISEATGISYAHLRDPKCACVAVKMSWAAKRETSRVEDMAYCLLGLFNISMPMLYGEGWNAFSRLQRKIIKTTDDESIFAWTDKGMFKPHGMLASAPSAFAEAGDVTVTSDATAVDRSPYNMTNKGLQLYTHVPGPNHHQTLIFGLNCELRSVPEGQDRYLAVKLEKVEGHWKRVNCNADCLRRSSIKVLSEDQGSSDSLGPLKAIYVQQEAS